MSEKFDVGDVVTAFGNRGAVVRVDLRANYGVTVEFEGGGVEYFTNDGKINGWQKEPSLKLIEKAKKEEPKKKYYRMLMRQNKSCSWYMPSILVDENFKTSTGEEINSGYERKLLTDWSVEL
jgi:hypothetical protein